MITAVATTLLRCELPIVALRARTLQLTRTAATFTEGSSSNSKNNDAVKAAPSSSSVSASASSNSSIAKDVKQGWPIVPPQNPESFSQVKREGMETLFF